MVNCIEEIIESELNDQDEELEYIREADFGIPPQGEVFEELKEEGE